MLTARRWDGTHGTHIYHRKGAVGWAQELHWVLMVSVVALSWKERRSALVCTAHQRVCTAPVMSQRQNKVHGGRDLGSPPRSLPRSRLLSPTEQCTRLGSVFNCFREKCLTLSVKSRGEEWAPAHGMGSQETPRLAGLSHRPEWDRTPPRGCRARCWISSFG